MPQKNNAAFLDIRDLTLQYKTTEHLVTATHLVSFQAYEADRLILLGPSGCGKSTILKAIGGFLKPVHGSISLKGKEVKRPGSDRAFVFQEFDQLLPWKTALQNVVFAITLTRKISEKQAKEEARELLAKVNLSKFEDAYPHLLSGGMKQRVAIARCLGVKAELVLMDEPFASLDALTRRKMQEELLALWEELRFTMVFVTHSIDEAVTLGSRIVLLSAHPGQVMAELNVPLASLEERRSSPEAVALRNRISQILFKDDVVNH